MSIEKRMAATPLVTDSGWIVGLATENVGGYSPLNYGPFDTELEAQKTADVINKGFGLSKQMALFIVLSSMFPMNDVAHARRVNDWAKAETGGAP